MWMVSRPQKSLAILSSAIVRDPGKFYNAVEKRKAELQLLAVRGGTIRVVLRRYSLPLLTRIMAQAGT